MLQAVRWLQFLSIVLSASFCLAAADVSITVPAEISDAGISITSSRDASFLGAIQDSLGSGVVRELGPVLPYLLIFKNNSQSRVHEITVQYTRTTAAGNNVTGTTRLNTRDPKTGTSLFGPGSVIIQTPSSLLTQLVAGSRSGKMPEPGIFSQAIQAAGDIFRGARFTGARIAVDSVVFESGAVVGPDRYGVIDEAQASIEVATEIMIQIENTTVSDTALKTWLTDMFTASEPRRLSSDGIPDHRMASKAKIAQMLLLAVKSGAARTDLKEICSQLQRERLRVPLYK